MYPNRSEYRKPSPSNQVWEFIHDSLCREYGIFALSSRGRNFADKCLYFIQEEESTEKVLDIIEVSFLAIDTWIRENPNLWRTMNISQKPDDAISELNQRFQEHGLGYQFLGSLIVRVDSDYIYREAVEPAVELLFQEEFEGASEEFLKAHVHFRNGQDKEAITEALKAFESVMKTICKRMRWEVDDKATAKKLIDVLLKNELVSSSLQTQLTYLRTILEGLPTVRNRNSGHGQGEKSIKVPRHLVAYALHLCATNIVFLIQSYQSLKE
ncbi:STM4504/CBY_0614 family protein [Heyndrickxia oleronia]|jgi:hypothetical protein|uniref:STM4504/CBY_0614 family protein n=1 Tax=Heyndrickxia oleronia TaxID=38875 RepID=UPI003750771E